MKTKRLVLARPGIYGTPDSPKPVTEQDLKEIAETFKEQKNAPLSFGHELADKNPKFGQVISVTYDAAAKELMGDVEMHDLLAEAYEEKFFDEWSIGAQRRAKDGKLYLHHLAILGEVPPAIKDLSEKIQERFEIAASAGIGEVIVFAAPGEKRLELSDGKKAEENPSGEKPEKKEDKVSEELKKENEDLKLKLSDQEKQIRSGAVERLKKSMEGKIPRDKHGLVLALADKLPLENCIELADSEGKKEKLSPMDTLVRIFDAVPKPVKEGALNLGDPSGEEQPADLSKIRSKV